MAAQRRSRLLQRISDFVTAERHAQLAGCNCAAVAKHHGLETYPASADVFRFTTTPLRQVKVVILGQDPYHGPGQADGLAFSVRDGVAIPPSLRNILIELVSDVGDVLGSRVRPRQGRERGDAQGNVACPRGDLTPWTRQGVLMLNTALTVRQGEPSSHLSQWQPFTDEVVRAVVDSAEVAPVFILWGSKARATFERAIHPILKWGKGPDGREWLGCHRAWDKDTPEGHVYQRVIPVICSPHPSPLSADRGFFGSRPFSRANLALQLNNPGVTAVDWRLP